MDCPRCALPLVTVDYEGVETDMCQSCWGFWLDRGELREVLERQELEFSDEERERILDVSGAWNSGPEEPAACPKCGKIMERLAYDESVHLVIDACLEHGHWLDTGEMKKVQAIADNSRAIHAMLLRKLGL